MIISRILITNLCSNPDNEKLSLKFDGRFWFTTGVYGQIYHVISWTPISIPYSCVRSLGSQADWSDNTLQSALKLGPEVTRLRSFQKGYTQCDWCTFTINALFFYRSLVGILHIKSTHKKLRRNNRQVCTFIINFFPPVIPCLSCLWLLFFECVSQFL